MRRKVENLAADINRVLSAWDSVECVTIGEHSEGDTLDPYFALVIDAYYRVGVPSSEQRREALAEVLGDPGAFESSSSRPKDRFFIKGLPVRIEYKNVDLIEAMIGSGSGADPVWLLENSGTYPLYRLQVSRVLFHRSDWIDRVRASLKELSETLWRELREAFETKMDHYLADLGAAALREDAFFYEVSLSGFARNAAAALFVANRRFEPSARNVNEQLFSLASIPDDFRGRWEILLRGDLDISRSQKREVAELIARSVIALR